MTMQVQTDPYAAFKTAYAGSAQEKTFGPLDQAKLNNNDFLSSLPNEIFRLLPSDRLTGFDTKRLAKLPNEDVVALVRQNPNLIGGFPATYWQKFPGSFVQQEVIPHLQRTDQQGLAAEIGTALAQAPQGAQGATYRTQSFTGNQPGTGSSVLPSRPPSLYGPPPTPPRMPPAEPPPTRGNEVPGSNDYPNNPIPKGLTLPPQTAPKPAAPADVREGPVYDAAGNLIGTRVQTGVDTYGSPRFTIVPAPRPPAGSTARPRDAAAIAQDVAAAAAADAKRARDELAAPGERALTDAQVRAQKAAADRSAGLLPGEIGIQSATIDQIRAGIRNAETLAGIARLNSDRDAEAKANDLLFRYQELDRKSQEGTADRALRAELGYADSRRQDIMTGLGVRQQDLREAEALGTFQGRETLGGRAQSLAEARFQAEQRQNPSSILDRIYNSRGGIGPADANLLPPAPLPSAAPAQQAPAPPPSPQEAPPAAVAAAAPTLFNPPPIPPSPIAGAVGGAVEQAAGNLFTPPAAPPAPFDYGAALPPSAELQQQFQEWAAAKRAAGEDPSDPDEFRQHVIRMGSPDPGAVVGSLFGQGQPQQPLARTTFRTMSTPTPAMPSQPGVPQTAPMRPAVQPTNSTGAPNAFSVQQPQMPGRIDLSPPKPLTYGEISGSDVLDKTYLRPAFNNQNQPYYRAAGGVPQLNEQRLRGLTGEQGKVLDATLLASGTNPEDYRRQSAEFAQTGQANVGRPRMPRQRTLY